MSTSFRVVDLYDGEIVAELYVVKEAIEYADKLHAERGPEHKIAVTCQFTVYETDGDRKTVR